LKGWEEDRALAKALNEIEKGDPPLWLPEERRSNASDSWVIGVTGSPGVGKSTLVGGLVDLLLSEEHEVGVLAVDPTSPFSHGAFLGDRIRMQQNSLHPNLFIRSVGSHDCVGGLSESIFDMVCAMEAYQKKYIIIETVGAGQSDLDIMYIADCILLVLSPGSGDEVQIYKAGIMEIADIYAINKSDLPGIEKMVRDIQELLMAEHSNEPWKRKLICTQALRKKGIQDLWASIQDHQRIMRQSEKANRKRELRDRKHLEAILQQKIKQRLEQVPKDLYPSFHEHMATCMDTWYAKISREGEKV
jgi:LAO/AO transport system kinase